MSVHLLFVRVVGAPICYIRNLYSLSYIQDSKLCISLSNEGRVNYLIR